MNTEGFGAQVKTIFLTDRVACRLIAAWASFSTITALTQGGFDRLAFAQDISMLKLPAMIALFFVLFSVVAFFLQPYHSDSWFMMVAATACVFRWLLDFEHPTNEPLFWLAVTVVYAMLTVPFLRLNQPLLEKIQIGSRWVMGGAVLLALVSGGIIAAFTCLRYQTFCTPNFDFGLFCTILRRRIRKSS